MNILQQNKEKINGISRAFDRMIINRYILPFQNPRLFQFYLIQNNIKFIDFKEFVEKQTTYTKKEIFLRLQEWSIFLKYFHEY